MVGIPNYGSIPITIVVIDPNTGLPITSFADLGLSAGGGVWLLTGGIWADAGSWVDTNVWED